MEQPPTNPEGTTRQEDAGRPQRYLDFESSYAGTPPWDVGRPQPAFLSLAEAGAFRGRVLDVGCGTGEHALLAASMGLEAVGIDAAPTAIHIAQTKTRQRGLNVRFVERNALDLQALGERFDTVLDCGLFHVFDDADRTRFEASLRSVVRTGGQYFLLCFSDRQPGDAGPRRIRQTEIRECFANGWRVESIEATTLEVNLGPFFATHPQAWLATITRV